MNVDTSPYKEAAGGWRFGNTINGSQAEYLLVPYAQANLTKIPEGVSDAQVVLLADIAATGFSGAESGGVKIGDAVVVFAQGPICLCATAGAKLMGAAIVIGIDGDDNRLAMAKRMGADIALEYRAQDVVAEVKRLTGGGADVAIEALGTQQTFESALRCLRPGGTLSSLGVYSGTLQVPNDAFAAGLGDHRIVTTLCPGGKERMRRLIEVVAKEVGIERVFAEVLPENKADYVKKLQGEGKFVAMVGDGVNDAPALATADIGIAIGAGTDVATEAAKIVLMQSDPLDILNAIILSKATVRKMKQNLVWASVYNLLAIPVAAGAFYHWLGWSLRPEFSALLMSTSSIIVAVNAVMLRRSEGSLLSAQA